jgi:hypothetical protein
MINLDWIACAESVIGSEMIRSSSSSLVVVMNFSIILYMDFLAQYSGSGIAARTEEARSRVQTENSPD